MKKVIFRNFRYMYCDDFALYLQEMSEKGWHFSRFGIGLEFEQGEPKHTTYRVEVFDKAQEMDFKAEEETQEYSAYCEAAGWTFVDSKRKFCVFRSDDGSAPAITTEEERFRQIRKGEISLCLQNIAVFAFLFLSFFLTAWLVAFTSLFFDNLKLGILGLFGFLFFLKLADGIRTYLWFRRKYNQIDRGEIPFYGHLRRWCSILSQRSSLFYLPPFIVLAYFCYRYFGFKGTLAIMGELLLLEGFRQLLQHIRPGRDARKQIFAAAFVGIYILKSCISYYIEPQSQTFDNGSIIETSSFFGHAYSYHYATDVETDSKNNAAVTEFTSLGLPLSINAYMKVYESPYSWILKKSWHSLADRFYEYNVPKDTTAQWQAEKAISNTLGNVHIILYPDRVIYLSSNRGLTREELPLVQEKMIEKYGK